MPSRLAPSRRAVLWLLVGLGLLASAGPLSGTAGAHATLVSSTPGNDEVVAEAPQQVVLTFDDGVSVDDGGVTVLDPRGNDVADGSPTTSDDGLEVRQRITAEAKGTYTVSYRALSDDGHVIDGSYVFHVGNRTGSATASTGSQLDPLRVLNAFGRWVALSGALLVGGVLAMACFVDRHRPDDTDDADIDGGTGDGATDDGATDDADSAWTGGLSSARFLLLPGAASVLFGVGLSLLASAADLAGGSLADGPGNVGRFVTASWSGSVAGLRVLVALVLVLAVAGSTLLRKVPWLAVVCVLAALVLPSAGGHAWTASPAWLAVTSDALHVLAAAAWVGGLGVLVLTWDGSRGRAAAFSRMAVVAAPLTIATGLLNTWLQERSLSGLTDTTHGRLVLAKLVGALAMVALGWVHRRQLADAARWTARTVASYRVEAVIGLAVVAVTAVLVGTPPGREARPDAEPVQVVRQAGDTTVRMQVSPAVAGPNDVHLYYLARDGSLAPVDAAELEISTTGVSPRSVPITPITASHGIANGVQLTPGTWSFRLTIVTGGVPAQTTFEVPIS
ncbi:copper resistance CopC/CopD family protein [Dermatobacter hominis]|uniref:copper resistance CopC/CopD family protein n=1 Tax=Dermatobacter hominis TaxID=2884263 RepID=UPI001D12791C|nr:copper resistance protein CopC [Dermatobacter hominis]UDY35417.1 copper resistance protein CopC/CopD [Dermatobacter hominis]